jgi:hypothetical protein
MNVPKGLGYSHLDMQSSWHLPIKDDTKILYIIYNQDDPSTQLQCVPRDP